MKQPQTTANAPNTAKARRSSDRRWPCLNDGQEYPREALLGFIAGPDGKVHLLQDDNWPGQVVYVCATARALQQVIDSGTLAKALNAEVSADFLPKVRHQLLCRFYDLLGLAKKSNYVVAGLDKCVETLQKGKISSLFVAQDAAKNAEKAVDLAKYLRVPVLRLGDKNGLSGATGVSNATVIGLRDTRKHFEILWQAAQQAHSLQQN